MELLKELNELEIDNQKGEEMREIKIFQ